MLHEDTSPNDTTGVEVTFMYSPEVHLFLSVSAWKKRTGPFFSVLTPVTGVVIIASQLLAFVVKQQSLSAAISLGGVGLGMVILQPVTLARNARKSFKSHPFADAEVTARVHSQGMAFEGGSSSYEVEWKQLLGAFEMERGFLFLDPKGAHWITSIPGTREHAELRDLIQRLAPCELARP